MSPHKVMTFYFCGCGYAHVSARTHGGHGHESLGVTSSRRLPAVGASMQH